MRDRIASLVVLAAAVAAAGVASALAGTTSPRPITHTHGFVYDHRVEADAGVSADAATPDAGALLPSCLMLDGVNETGELESLWLDGLQAVTIVAWYYPTAANDNSVWNQDNSIGNGIHYGWFSIVGHDGMNQGLLDGRVSSTQAQGTDTWVLAVWALDGPKADLYLYVDENLGDDAWTYDGVDTYGPTTMECNNGPFQIGIQGTAPSTLLDGCVGDISVWTDTLDTVEIAELRAGGGPADLRNHSRYEDALNTWWTFGSGPYYVDTADTVYDQLGSGRDLVMYNTESGDYTADEAP